MFLCPIKNPAKLTQGFGERPDVYRQFGLKAHNGIDLSVPFYIKGEVLIHASMPGYVYQVGDQGARGYGKFVRQRTYENNEGIVYEIIYGHLRDIDVKLGHDLPLGNVLGVMGNTGFSTGPHVHWGVRKVKKGKILNENDGYSGYINVLPWTLYWKD